MAGRGLTAASPSRFARFSVPVAARRQGDAPQGVHHGDVDGGAILFLLEIELGHNRSRHAGDVPRWDAVEGIDEGVVATDLAAAEFGEMRPQRIVGGDDVLFRHVSNHNTANEAVATAPVKVEPVVPVRRTV